MTEQDRAAAELAIERMRAENAVEREHIDRVLAEEVSRPPPSRLRITASVSRCDFDRGKRHQVFSHFDRREDAYGGMPQEVKLLERMLSIGCSIYHPDPVAEIARIDAEARAEAARAARQP